MLVSFQVLLLAALLWVATADDDIPSRVRTFKILRAPTSARAVNVHAPSSSYTSYPAAATQPRSGYRAASYPAAGYSASRPSYVQRSYADSYQQPRYYEPRPYQFAYGVNDQQSGTVMSRSEQSDGTTTRGQYSVNLPDGCVQTVSYTADAEHGYRADVSHDCSPAPSYTPTRSYSYGEPAYQPSAAYQPAASYRSAAVSRQSRGNHHRVTDRDD